MAASMGCTRGECDEQRDEMNMWGLLWEVRVITLEPAIIPAVKVRCHIFRAFAQPTYLSFKTTSMFSARLLRGLMVHYLGSLVRCIQETSIQVVFF